MLIRRDLSLYHGVFPAQTDFSTEVVAIRHCVTPDTRTAVALQVDLLGAIDVVRGSESNTRGFLCRFPGIIMLPAFRLLRERLRSHGDICAAFAMAVVDVATTAETCVERVHVVGKSILVGA